MHCEHAGNSQRELAQTDDGDIHDRLIINRRALDNKTVLPGRGVMFENVLISMGSVLFMRIACNGVNGAGSVIFAGEAISCNYSSITMHYLLTRGPNWSFSHTNKTEFV